MFHIRHQRRSSSAFSCSRSTEIAFNPWNDCFVIMPDWQRVTESLTHIAGGWHHILVVGIDTSLMDGTESLINGRNRFTDGCDFLLYHEAVFEPGRDSATLSRSLFECRTKINHPCHQVANKYQMSHI